MQKPLLHYLKPLFESIKTNKFFYIFFGIVAFSSFYGIFNIYIASEIIFHIENKNIEKIYFWIYVFSFLTFLFLIVKIFYDSVYFSFHWEIEKFFTEKYFQKFLKLDNTEVEKYGMWRMNSVLSTGIGMAENILSQIIFTIVSIISVIYTFYLIFVRIDNILYFSVILWLFAIIIWIFWISLKQIFEIRKISKEFFIEIDRRKVRILSHKFEILQNKKGNDEIGKILEIYNTEWKITWNAHLKKWYFFAMADAILKGLQIAIFVVVGVWVVLGNYEIATFALFLWLLQKLTESAWEIRSNISSIVSMFVHWEKLVDVFDEIPEMRDTKNLPDFVYKTGKIELKNIDFSYNNEKYVFKNFSLSLEWGKKYAFVGESGGGKSTILKLLSAYISPNSGKILVDNQDISEISLENFYKNIWYLSQEPSVFDGTILENLVYSLDDVPSEKILKKILADAKCDFVFEFEKWLETEIGERGVRLSGGQKQRLAIAKIMLKNPKIILLDEATSALDSFNESQISDALEVLFEGKTVIIVAHRLQTVKSADMIFFLENGKILETGSHTELIAKKWKYFQMIELQSGF